jgi:hypothetical protein
MIPGRQAPGLAMAALSLLGMACTGAIGGDSDRPSDDPAASPNDPSKPNKGNDTGKGGAMGQPDPTTKPPPDPKPGPDGVIDSAGPYALRRLSRLEFSNTVRDLVGVALTDADLRGLATDQVLSGGFGSGAAIATSTDSRQFLDLSAKIATAATADLTKLMPADCAAPAAAAEQGCIGKFVEQFGLRAFRRPLNSSETSAFLALFTKLRGSAVGAPYAEAVQDVLLAVLQSPEFLYRWELDGQPIQDGDLIKFGPYEVASRLSYFLWASMPDDQLFAAAKMGALGTPDQIAAQAERLLKDPRAKDGLRDFHMQWLGLYGVDELDKDPVFTTYSPEVAKAMLAETSAFIDATMFGPQATGKIEDLLTSSSSYLNAALAKHYGVAGVTGNDLQKVALDPTQRAGILTQGAYLAKHSKEVDSFPIARGVHILRQVLCQEIPEPMIQLPPAPEQMQGVTTRQLYTDFTKASACQACHGQINAAGFAFENYDAAGGFRAKEEGQTVDSSGSLDLPSGKLTFKNGIEFVKALAASPEVRDCVARNWMRALLRREERDIEAGSLKAIAKAFAASSFDMRSVIVGLTRTRAFTHRNPNAQAGK